ncbi:MAG TPA: hypothetical protein PKJ15_03555 [Methanomassiliicoccales archaeon]|nr:hypothetical protein [Methanomassiliicoccales archaeon]
MTELDEDDELHLEMHRAVDELGKFSLHMKVDFGKGTSAEKAISFVEELLIKATDACLHHGADLVGHVKAFMMVEDGSTVGFSLIHQKMSVNITKQVNTKIIERAEVIVHVIVHGIWDPEVREQTMGALEEVSMKNKVKFEIIKDFFEIEKSAAHHEE